MESKSSNILTIVFAVIAFIVVGVLIYDHVQKSNELEAKSEQIVKLQNQSAEASKDLSNLKDEISKLAQGVQKNNNYTEQSRMKNIDGLENNNQKLFDGIANSVSGKISPLIKQLQAGQKVNNKHLLTVLEKMSKSLDEEKVAMENELRKKEHTIATLKAKNGNLSEEQKEALKALRVRYARVTQNLFKKLIATRAVVAQLRAYSTKYSSLYIKEMGEDSFVGDLKEGVVVPVNMIKNLFTADIVQGKDNRESRQEATKRLNKILAEYDKIYAPTRKSKRTYPVVLGTVKVADEKDDKFISEKPYFGKKAEAKNKLPKEPKLAPIEPKK
jgi:hypothetical protein